MSSGRHRRPRRVVVWGQSISRALSGAAGGSLARLFRSGQKARLAALDAEVVALRLTVAQMREAVAAAEATATALAAELADTREQLAASREQLTAPAQGPAAMPVTGPPVALELPLVRLALARTAGRTLDREMAAALAAADRSSDTARTEIVLSDLPERALLDPATDRDDAAQHVGDPAAAAAPPVTAAVGATRRIA